MRVKLLLTLFIITLFGLDAFAQSSWDDQNKYWYYRYRLVNDFLIRGEEDPIACNKENATGYSIPAGNSLVGAMDLDWGDGTTYLGWYISVLATEYRLLANVGQSTEATKRELYYAMKAYERLDKKAEVLFFPYRTNENCDGYLNGCFVRDDVSKALLDAHPELTSKYLADDGQLTFNSDYHKYNEEANYSSTKDSNIYLTQDQVSDLFMGFALVKKCLGNESYQGYNFAQNAIHYTDLIASRLNNNFWIGKLDNGDVHHNGYNIIEEVSAYGIAKAAEFITGQNYQSNLLPTALGVWESVGDPVQGTIYMEGVYSDLGDNKDWTTALIQTFAAIGSSWKTGIVAAVSEQKVLGIVVSKTYTYSLHLPGVQPVIIAVITLPFPISYADLPDEIAVKNVTSAMLTYYGKSFRQEIYPLLHEYLHEEQSGIDVVDDSFLQILQNAPCEGPEYKPRDDESRLGSEGWRGVNRWERPLSGDGFIDTDNKEGRGRYNGLDYLLAYNIYLLARNPFAEYRNLLNVNSANQISEAGKYWSYETLELSGTVQSNESTNSDVVEITTNNGITLKPGFKIEPGANARIYIGSYTACNTSRGNTSNLRRVSLSDSQNKILAKDQLLKTITSQVQTQVDSLVNKYNNDNEVSNYVALKDYLASGVSNETSGEQVTLFPNPTNGSFSVELKLKSDQKVKIVLSNIYDSYETILFDGSLLAGANRLKFDIKDFKSGLFNIEIRCIEFNAIRRLIKLEQ